MAEKEEVERKVYLLPTELAERIRAYQVSQGIPSEVEAARRLLVLALQMRDSVVDILNTLKAKFVVEKDLRVLARDVLTNHALVTQITFDDASVTFQVRAGGYGSIDNKGGIWSGDDADRMSRIVEPRPWERAAQAKAPQKGGDLDDEIPF